MFSSQENVDMLQHTFSRPVVDVGSTNPVVFSIHSELFLNESNYVL